MRTRSCYCWLGLPDLWSMYAEIHKAAALKEGEAEVVAVAVKAQPMRLSSPENKKGDHIKGGAVVCETVPCCRPSY